MRRRKMTKREKRLVLWANLILVTGFCAWYFGVATLFVLETRYMEWKSPVVKITPAELADSSVSHALGRKLSYFGYEFETPWNDLDEAKTKQVGKVQLIAFRSGITMLFSRTAPREFVHTVLQSSKTNPENVRKFFGEEALRSDYSLYRLILEATPAQITLLTPREEAARGSMLLVMKGLMMPRGGESGIFRIRAGEFQGFQYGDPRTHPKSLDVEMFSDDGGIAFVFSQSEKGTAPLITQAEINRVTRTARRLVAEELSASR